MIKKILAGFGFNVVGYLCNHAVGNLEVVQLKLDSSDF